MSNLFIYSENDAQNIEEMCKEITDFNIRIISYDEIKDIDSYEPSLIILDMPIDKLKELTAVTKFSVPLIVVVDEMPNDVSIRGEAFDYVLNPINKYEFQLRIKNMLKIKELKDKVLNVSTTDDLTGLHNRRYLLERFDSEISRAKRNNSSVSCILFDIDFFKVVNDMYGYEWGDELLKQIAEMLSNLARKEDLVTRYGDEEFMVILPDTTEDKAFIFAERFRRDIEKLSFRPDGEEEDHPVRISGGIASYPQIKGAEENSNTIIRYAEHALYNAKKRGKNRIMLFSQVNLDY